jgi:hypothetical protein
MILYDLLFTINFMNRSQLYSRRKNKFNMKLMIVNAKNKYKIIFICIYSLKN